MGIGSNNSLSYLTPNGFWSKVFRWFNRCQSKQIQSQYIYGKARFFDIKLDVNKYNRITVKNYNIFSLYEIFDFFNKMGNAIVYITFDADKDMYSENDYKIKKEKFAYYCGQIESIYQNIKFCGGKNNFDGETLYKFKNPTPKIYNPTNDFLKYKIATCISPKWTKKLNEKIIENYKDYDYILLNHIG